MSNPDLEIRKRRMHWAVSSPSLLQLPQSVDFFHDAAHLKKLTLAIDGCDILPELSPKLRMGKYFEQLVLDSINLDPTKELIMANQPVLEGKITIGEIDLIIKDLALNEYQHWEVALKYYLQTHEGRSLDLMIGPNAIDSLDRKLKKLQERQLPLSDHLKFVENLDAVGITRLSKKVFLKGMLFYHLGKSSILPEHVHPEHQSGWWIFQHEADEFLDVRLKWNLCWKPDWIGPSQFQTEIGLLSKAEMLQQIEVEFERSNRSVLLIGLKEIDGIWQELTRGFVVNDDWPHLILEKG